MSKNARQHDRVDMRSIPFAVWLRNQSSSKDQISMSTSGKYVPPHRRRQEAGKESPPDDSFRNRWTDDDDHHQQSLSFGSCEEDVAVEELCKAFSMVYCINLRQRVDRWEKFCRRMEANLGKRCKRFIEKVERFDAIDGAALVLENKDKPIDDVDFPRMDWDASKNALYDRHVQPPMNKCMTPGEVGCAMSHTKLWRLLDERNDLGDTMLILEDDAVFYLNEKREFSKRPSTRKNFLEAFTCLGKVLPADWDILYLGFSPRGAMIPVDILSSGDSRNMAVEVNIFRPTYGFHTHAYALTKTAASTLLSNGPVVLSTFGLRITNGLGLKFIALWLHTKATMAKVLSLFHKENMTLIQTLFSRVDGVSRRDLPPLCLLRRIPKL